MLFVKREGKAPSMGRYTLIVTEKPDAAKRIAEALDPKGMPKKVDEKSVPYFMVNADSPIVVVPALGHLYTVVSESVGRSTYPVFNLKWAPRSMAEKGAQQVEAWIKLIAKLAENTSRFVDACDYDVEGSLIGYTILKYACGNKENTATRMKYSTLTKEELRKSYAEQIPHLDFGMIEAGKTRHEIDWLYGVNISRALTMAANHWSRRYNTLSTGRVQGPTLKFLAARERSIKSFVPTPYWSILAEVEIRGRSYPASYHRRIFENKADADKVVKNCLNRLGTVERIEERKVQVPPPIPFDLGSLQSEAYSLFGYSPRRTSNVSQHLYLDALISYPRTSSQKLPTAINYPAILGGLSKEPAYRIRASELLERRQMKPREGSQEDSAHPAIYPTGNRPSRQLEEAERRIWDLVVKRFFAVFGDFGIKQSIKAIIKVDTDAFYLYGRRVLEEGWMKYYKPYVHSDEFMLPPMKEGETVRISKIACEDKFTKPPPRYNPSSLLKRMEAEGIGTKATRADVIETLYRRKYIAEERIVVTDLGFDIIDVLRKHAPIVISVKLTQELEEKMERIQSNNERRENVLTEAIDRLKPLLIEIKSKEIVIGEALSDAIKMARGQERIIGPCPACHTGRLMILFSRRTKKRFIGCTNYFKNSCKASFPLPQRGTVKHTDRLCRNCGWPLLFVHSSGKRPWNLCFNPACPEKEKRRARLEM
jgi:DNA topoisomerase-1